MQTAQSARAKETPSRSGIRFELHAAKVEQGEIVDAAHLPWRPARRLPSQPALTVWDGDGPTWARVDAPDAPAPLATIPARQPGALGLEIVRRQFSAYLALRSLRDDLLVNGLPALRFSVLSSQDSLVLTGPGLTFYVTERFFPRVGPPPAEAIGRERCAHCRTVFAADDRIVSCYCGALYHWHTKETHPDQADGDRLECLQQRKLCACCQRELTTKEYLVWDPITI
jgi:hypothetical protein